MTTRNITTPRFQPSDKDAWLQVRRLLQEGVAQGIFPGAVALVSLQGEIRFWEAVGWRMRIPEALPMSRDTVFDLASLTKPLATATLLMDLVASKGLDLDAPIHRLLPIKVPREKRTMTPRLLLCHASGLPAWRPLYREVEGLATHKARVFCQRAVLETPLEYPPGKGTVYSDLGYMLLEWMLEEATGMGLAQAFREKVAIPLGLTRLFLYAREDPPVFPRRESAATEACPWRGEVLQGKVHDENAYAMGGHSGHAGLFGSAWESHRLIESLLRSHRGEPGGLFPRWVVREFFRRQGIPPESSWALGWDTPSEQESSSGGGFSRRSVGHLGFTGTSIWMDLDAGLIVLLFTNRVHPSRKNDRIRAFRPRFHDAVREAIRI